MTRGRKVLIGLGVVGLLGAVAFANFRLRRDDAKAVSLESVQKRDLAAVVSASGKIQPKRSVNISADVMGRVTELAVNEGDTVRQGQFLLQIDPRNLATNVRRGEAALEATESQLAQGRQTVAAARERLSLARDTLQRQRDLWAQGLTTKETLDRAENEVRVLETQLRESQQALSTAEARIREQRATLAGARYDLSKVRIESPIDGIITRRNIEQGEMVVIGTMNNAGTVMLTIADMSVIEAEVEVDETDIPSIRTGQPAKITIDAMPDKSFAGKVTEIGNSPIQTAAAQAGQQATNFKVVVTLDGQIPDVRPGFTCTAEITTATRSQALAVPIQALAVRELVFDKDGKIVRPPKEEGKRRRRSGDAVAAAAAADQLPAGQTRKETEGVFVSRDGLAEFVPVKTGIAGDKYFEVLSGLNAGDQVVTGPFSVVRELAEGDKVKAEEKKARK
jgi:HlyD family secretion protein